MRYTSCNLVVCCGVSKDLFKRFRCPHLRVSPAYQMTIFIFIYKCTRLARETAKEKKENFFFFFEL